MNKKEALNIALHLSSEDLFKSAKALREKCFGKRIHLCGILNAKCGRCSMDCKFCSQSGHNGTKVPYYPFWSEDVLKKAIMDVCAHADRCGVVTSGGKLSDEDVQTLIGTLESLPNDVCAQTCGSLGRLGERQLADLLHAGMRRFHHNLETSENFYPNICTTQRWRERYEVVRTAKELGFEVCSGGLFGLGESWEDRIDLALTVEKLKVDCMPINFLNPHPGTPYENAEKLSPDEALRIIAVFRHILPTTSLRICGGRSYVLGDRQYEIFDAGADALMIGDYLTTKGESLEKDLEAVSALGLEVPNFVSAK